MTNESLLQKKRRNLYLKAYLSELAVLTGRTVNVNELSSADEVSLASEAARKFCLQQSSRAETLFSEKESHRFSEFIENLHKKNRCPVSIWTPRTVDCGLIFVSSIAEIQFDFDFSLNEDGIVSFLTKDLEDSLLLDFSESTSGDKILQIETKGPAWGGVAF